MVYLTEKETQSSVELQINRLNNLFHENPDSFTQVLDFLPVMVSSNDVLKLEFNFVNQVFCERVGRDNSFLLDGGSSYTQGLVHPRNLDFIKQQLVNFNNEENLDRVLSYLHYVNLPSDNSDEYCWLITHKRHLDRNRYITLYYSLKEFGGMASVMSDYLGDFDMSLSNYQRFQTLTKQERVILKYIIQGYTNKEIAEKLFSSFNTIRTHRNRIWKKLSIKHFRDAMRFGWLLT